MAATSSLLLLDIWVGSSMMIKDNSLDETRGLTSLEWARA